MASKIPYTFIKLVPFISLLLYFLITTTSNPHSVLAEKPINEEDSEFYILDETPTIITNTTRTRILVSKHHKKIRKGMRCHVKRHNICNGVKADNGTSLLYCCKKHCRNVLDDMNNCGRCGQKCRFGQRCCGGFCTDVGFDPKHCGQCNKQCKSGAICEYGYCGYA